MQLSGAVRNLQVDLWIIDEHSRSCSVTFRPRRSLSVTKNQHAQNVLLEPHLQLREGS